MQDGTTALAYAVGFGCAGIARFLLENGATMDFEDNVKRTDMILCSEQSLILSCRFGKSVFTVQVNEALVKLCQLC